MISRLLRKRGSILLAAKLLVISRLLHKKLSEGRAHQDKAFYIEGIRSKLAKLRLKILDNIDTIFGSLDVGQPVLVEAMCAFALATSSSARDILRHFHHLRAEAIVSHMQYRQGSHGVDSMLSAMRLWIRSIQETHAIFPRQLSTALIKLKAAPLFSGDDVKGIAELDQDVHGEWIGDDIRNFTPYIRHDDLDSKAVEELLSGWASMALGRYLERVQTLLKGIEDYDEVVQLRKRTLDLLFTSGVRVTGVDKRHAVNSLRDASKKRLLEIAQQQCFTLETVSQSIRTTLQAWERDPPNVSLDLWDRSLASIDISHGAPAFIDALKSRVHGTSSASKRITQQYQTWLRGMQDFENVIEKMRMAKWEEGDDDDLVTDVDDDSLDDFDTRQNLLGVVDPDDLNKGLEALTEDAASSMQSAIDKMVQGLDDPSSAAKAAFIIRLLRESLATPATGISVSLPTLYCSPKSLIRLYDVLAIHVTRSSLQTCKSSVTKSLARRGLPQRALWEGNPELPVLPSPWTVRVLQSLTREMGDLGVDVWSKGAVERVKTVTREEVEGLIGGILREEESEAKNPEKDKGGKVNNEAEDQKHKKNPEAPDDRNGLAPDTKSPPIKDTKEVGSQDRSIQLAFDLAYLHQATSLPTTKPSSHALPGPFPDEADASKEDQEADALSSIYHKTLSKLSLDVEGKRRIESGAAEYWKRTSLLFALLG